MVFQGVVPRSALALVLVVGLAACSSSKGGGPAKPPRASSFSPSADALATKPAPPGDPAAAAITSYLKGLKNFTGSAVVVKRGVVLARYAAGDADEARKQANRPDTVFRIASVSKQFTSMMVLKLRDRGMLGLDDPVCKYLVPSYVASCPKAWRPITLRQTLDHTSGIPDISEMSDFFDKLDQPTTTKALIGRFLTKKLDFKPGSDWKYSNSGYILAGAAIEKVTGKSFGEVLQEQITGPLALRQTGFSEGQPPAGAAKGYAKKGTAAGLINGSQANAAGGVYTTAEDLTRWDRAFGANLVAPAGTVREAFTSQARCPSAGCLDSPSNGYGLGWLIDRLDGHTFYYHPGLLEGFHASNGYLPDSDIAVAVLSNVQTTDVNGVLRHLAVLAQKSS